MLYPPLKKMRLIVRQSIHPSLLPELHCGVVCIDYDTLCSDFALWDAPLVNHIEMTCPTPDMDT